MKKKWLVSLVFLIVMIVVMRFQGKSLITPASPLGILDLEFARTGDKLQQLKLFWNPHNLAMNIYLDFLFIISYVWFLVTASMEIRKNVGWERPGKWAVTLAIAAGFFDVLENFLMMLIYNGRFDTSLLQLVFVLAVLKFALVILVFFFIVATLPLILFKKHRRSAISKKYF
jgi:hypothetical protein